MKGFKNSTKVQYMKGGSCEGYAKGGSVKGAAKISKVMGEFKSGKLHSGSKEGPEVSNPKQAMAIALSEARKAGAKVPIKREGGGRATMADLERANRDTGGMGKRAVEAAGEAIARGNRMAVEEGNESRLVKRKTTPKSREVAVERSQAYSRAEPTDARGYVPPSQRGEMQMARERLAHPGWRDVPLVGDIGTALGFKKGGLAVMPRGKKC